MKTYDQMFQYVQNYLINTGCDEATTISTFAFRKRHEHTRRVFHWAKRLIEGEAGINTQAVLTAAIFHDIGYALLPKGMEHAQNSAVLCEKYLMENHYDSDFIRLVVFLVKNHSHKELLKNADTPLELILLMEADLLDESGALSIVWDCMAEGAKESPSYEKTYHHIMNYSVNTLNINPMVTKKAKAFWEDKQRFAKIFIDHLSFDLGSQEALL